MALFLCYRSLGISKTITVKNAANQVIVPGENDTLRVKIGYEGATPLLTVTTTTSQAGSILTVDRTDGEHTLRLDATDLAAIPPGTYTLFIEYYDNADGSEWKNVDRQVFQLVP